MTVSLSVQLFVFPRVLNCLCFYLSYFILSHPHHFPPDSRYPVALPPLPTCIPARPLHHPNTSPGSLFFFTSGPCATRRPSLLSALVSHHLLLDLLPLPGVHPPDAFLRKNYGRQTSEFCDILNVSLTPVEKLSCIGLQFETTVPHFGAIIPSHVQCCFWQTWCQSDPHSLWELCLPPTPLPERYLDELTCLNVGQVSLFSFAPSVSSRHSQMALLFSRISQTPILTVLNPPGPHILSGVDSRCFNLLLLQPASSLKTHVWNVVKPFLHSQECTCFIPSLSSWLCFWGEKTEIMWWIHPLHWKLPYLNNLFPI